MPNDKIRPCLWFKDNMEEAINFYVSALPDSHIENVFTSAVDTPGAKTDEPIVINFTLCGLPYQALQGGMEQPDSMNVSLSVQCETQDELDRIWNTLTADGGQEIMCGWCKDKYGLHWQIVPTSFFKMMKSDDRAAAARMTEAMHQMVKFDIAKLEAAFKG